MWPVRLNWRNQKSLAETKHLYNLINTPKMQNDVDRYSTAHRIQWTHTSACSPHFGGLWEAAVKSMKQLSTKIVGQHNLFMDELYFLTVEIEAVLNSQPPHQMMV